MPASYESRPEAPLTSQPRKRLTTTTILTGAVAILAAGLALGLGIPALIKHHDSAQPPTAAPPAPAPPPKPAKRSYGPQVVLPSFTGLGITAMAVDSAGNLYVTDYGGGHVRVQKLPPGSSTPEALPFTGLGQPMDVAVDSTGTLYIADGGGNTHGWSGCGPAHLPRSCCRSTSSMWER